MQKALIPFLVIATAGLLVAEDTQFSSLMKSMNTAYDALRQADFMSNQRSIRNAERLGTSYEELIEFWRQQKVVKAVSLSETGKSTAVQLADAMHSGNAEQAAALVKAIGATCHSCHEAYREKLPDGKYRIKSEDPTRRVTAKTP